MTPRALSRPRPANGAPRHDAAIIVRRARVDDAPSITAMRLALLAEEACSPLFAELHPDAERRASRLSAAQLAGPRQIVLIAEHRNAGPLGMVRCVIARGSSLVRQTRHAVLTTAYVRPAHRRRGVLRALLRAADEWCRAQHLPEMRLHCTVENAAGNAAWQSLGFSACELRHRRLVPRA